jgi:hypothetical protein
VHQRHVATRHVGVGGGGGGGGGGGDKHQPPTPPPPSRHRWHPAGCVRPPGLRPGLRGTRVEGDRHQPPTPPPPSSHRWHPVGLSGRREASRRFVRPQGGIPSHAGQHRRHASPHPGQLRDMPPPRRTASRHASSASRQRPKPSIRRRGWGLVPVPVNRPRRRGWGLVPVPRQPSSPVNRPRRRGWGLVPVPVNPPSIPGGSCFLVPVPASVVGVGGWCLSPLQLRASSRRGARPSRSGWRSATSSSRRRASSSRPWSRRRRANISAGRPPRRATGSSS